MLAVADELHRAREHLTVRLLPPEPPARPGTDYVEGTTPPPEGTDAYEGRVRRQANVPEDQEKHAGE